MDQRIKDHIQFFDLSQSDAEVSARMEVSDRLPSLQGHFPGNPILPAVTIIDISLFLLSQHVDSIRFNKLAVEKSKFTGMIRPKQKVLIRAQKTSSTVWKVYWSSDSDQSPLAQLQIVV
jgi:3-hydroxymyristoyl/3-hydroxydecanoyl-(acyl carrier protein) dehydratase